MSRRFLHLGLPSVAPLLAILANLVTAQARAEPAPVALVFTVDSRVPAATIKSLPFKQEVNLAGLGYASVPYDSLVATLPVLDDPWWLECAKQPSCLAGLASRLRAPRLFIVALSRTAGVKIAVALTAWISPGHVERLQLVPVAPKNLDSALGEGVRIVLAALEPYGGPDVEPPQPPLVSEPDSTPAFVAPPPNSAPPAVLAPPLQVSAPAPPQPEPSSPDRAIPTSSSASEGALWKELDTGMPQAAVEYPGADGTPSGGPPASGEEPGLPTPSAQPAPAPVFGECRDAFEPVAAAAVDPESAQPVFIKPTVLLLPIEGVGNVSSRDPRAFASYIDTALIERIRLKRIDFVRHCLTLGGAQVAWKPRDHERLTLELVKAHPPLGVEWVFAPKLVRWKEEPDGESFDMESEVALDVLAVRGSALVSEFATSVSVPGILDAISFYVMDTADQAKATVIKSATSAIPGGDSAAGAAVQGVVSDVMEAAGLGDTLSEYERKLDQNLGMAGDRLALKIRDIDRFRLSSPVFGRDDDELNIGLGDTEGLSLNDTYVFSRDGFSWEGFGRVAAVGPGGVQALQQPSQVEVIVEPDWPDEQVRVLEYPLLGIQLGGMAGFLPVRHNAAWLAVGSRINRAELGMPGFSIDVRLRIPWIPVAELYETNAFTLIFDDPLLILGGEFGVEKRFLWGRWTPEVGLRYSLLTIGLPIPDPAGGGGSVLAVNLAHGIEAYIGIGIFVHPTVTLHLQAGGRVFFSRLSVFDHNGGSYYARDASGEVWDIDLSGPVFRLVGFYEI